MDLYILLIGLFISFVFLKYFQFKSFKYLKSEYELIKPNFLFHGAYYQNKYYADKRGIKLKNVGAFIFLLGGLLTFVLTILFR